MILRIFALVTAVVLLMSTPSNAEIWDAPRAHAAVQAGEAVMLDIRTPREWAETGVPQGAWPVDLYNPGFGARLQQVLADHGDAPILLICATGGRTAYVVQALARSGITGVVDVSEGIHGSPNGPGWLDRGMPLVSSQEAQMAMPEGLRDN